MTVATSVNRAQFLGSGSAGPFTFNMKFFANSDIVVIHVDADDVETVLVEGTGYTLTGAGNAVGGAVTLTEALATGEALTVVRLLDMTQPASIRNQGAFYPEIHEDAFDRLTMQIQQVDEQAARAIKMPQSVSGDFTVPSGERAGTVLGFDSTGAPVFVTTGDGVAMHLLGDETAYGVKSFETVEVRGNITVAGDFTVAGPASLAAAVTAIGTEKRTIEYPADLTLTANIEIPENIELVPKNGAIINHGAYTIEYLGSTARWPLAQIFNGTGAITYGPNTPWDHPEWYGAIADAATDGSGTDSTVALQKSFNCPTPTKLSSGNYLFSNLTLPTLKTVVGTGIHSTNLIAKTGSTGTVLTEQGYAAKISLREFAVYCRDQAYTGGLKLGYTLGGTGVFGTEGLIDNIWVRDLPAGFPGIDINANVGQFGRIMAQSTGGVRIIGTGNMVGHVESMQSRGFTVTRYDTTTLEAACNFGDTQVGAVEVEATAEGVVPIYFSGNTHISSVYLAPTAGATHPHLIEMDPSSTTWKIDNLKFYFHEGAAPIITNGNIKSGSTYFGGNASGKSYAGQGNYSSDQWLAGNTFAVANQKLQSFVLSIANNTSTLQHRFQDTYGTGAVVLDDMITGAAYAWNNTPTGADASTAFVAGGKIGSASTNTFWLDTPNAQITANCLSMATVQLNSCGTALTVVPAIYATDINGTSKARLCLQFYNAATGAAYPLTTANIADGKTIQVLFMGFLR